MSIQFPANPPLNDTFDYDGKTYIWDGEKWTASISNSFDDAYVNIDGDTMTGDLTVPSLNGGPLAGLRNQLINGDFRIWQRGTDISNAGASLYTADRWKETGNTVGARTIQSTTVPIVGGFSLADYSVTLTATTGSFQQGVEIQAGRRGLPFVKGTQWTLSFWVQNYDYSAAPPIVTFSDKVGTSTNVVQLSVSNRKVLGTSDDGTWTHLSYLVDIDDVPAATNTSLTVILVGGAAAGGVVRYTNVQLEPGPVATPFEHRPIGTELALCQRYYQDIGTLFMSINGSPQSTDDVQWSGPIRPEMRATPTANGTPVNNVTSLNFTATSKTLRANCRAANTSSTCRVEDLTLDAEL